MITGAHVVVTTRDAEADRAFFRDVLGFPSVDAGHGWLIFALPATEASFHPGDSNSGHELYLMCDDLEATIARLSAKGVECRHPHQERWGSIISVPLPGGGVVRLYQPKHATALGLVSK